MHNYVKRGPRLFSAPSDRQGLSHRMNAKAKEPREPQRGGSERYTTDQMVVVFVGRRLNKSGSTRPARPGGSKITQLAKCLATCGFNLIGRSQSRVPKKEACIFGRCTYFRRSCQTRAVCYGVTLSGLEYAGLPGVTRQHAQHPSFTEPRSIERRITAAWGPRPASDCAVFA